jgi:hypothetical protein
MLIPQKQIHSDQGSHDRAPPEHIDSHKDARVPGDFEGDKSLPADVRGSGTLNSDFEYFESSFASPLQQPVEDTTSRESAQGSVFGQTPSASTNAEATPVNVTPTMWQEAVSSSISEDPKPRRDDNSYLKELWQYQELQHEQQSQYEETQ